MRLAPLLFDLADAGNVLSRLRGLVIETADQGSSEVPVGQGATKLMHVRI